jgi:hypothetical protein
VYINREAFTMNQIKQPDLNAPRFRPTRTSLLTKKFFRQFRKKYPQYNTLTNSNLRKVINDYNTLLWQEVINNRDGVELPENLGFLFIGTCRPVTKRENIDHPTSFIHNVRLKHRNFESDNHLAKIFYTNYAGKYKFRNRELWQFKGERDFTRALGKAYPLDWKKYIQVENFQRINSIFKSGQAREYFNKKTEVDLVTYNEFDMN